MGVWLLVGAIAAAGQVHLTSTDGVALAGEEWGTGARGILLVHDEGGTHADWGKLGQKLGMSGYHVLAIDLRGHGASPVSTPLSDDWSGLVADVNGAVGWLTSHGATEIHVVGARFGANLSLVAASQNAGIGDLVLLSPSLNLHNVKISSALTGYGERSLFVAVGATDALSVRAARWLDASAKGAKHLALLDGVSQGAHMLQEAPELESSILSWFSGALRTPASDSDHLSKEAELRTGVNDIHTTGVRIDEK